MSPSARTWAASMYPWTWLVTVLSVTDTPTDAPMPEPPNDPASANAPAAARISDSSVAVMVTGPLLVNTPSPSSLLSLIYPAVVLTMVLPEPAPAPLALMPPLADPATATPMVRARISGSDWASISTPPALVTPEFSI